MVRRKQNAKQALLMKLAKRAIFSLSDARAVGMSHPVLLQLVKEGKVTRLSRGLYAVAGSEAVGQEADYAIAQKKFGKWMAISGLTALFSYQLIDESPTKIWLLVPPNVQTSDRKYRLLRTNRDLKTGIQDNGKFRIASLERALVDAVVFQVKIGEQVAKLAIIRALRRKLTTSEKIFRMGDSLGVLPKLEQEWPSILAGLSQ